MKPIKWNSRSRLTRAKLTGTAGVSALALLTVGGIASTASAQSIYPQWTPYIVGNAPASSPITLSSGVLQNQIASPLFLGVQPAPQVTWQPTAVVPPVLPPLVMQPPQYPQMYSQLSPQFPTTQSVVAASPFPRGYVYQPTGKTMEVVEQPALEAPTVIAGPIETTASPIMEELPKAFGAGQIYMSAKFGIGSAGDADYTISTSNPASFASGADSLAGGSLAVGYSHAFGIAGIVPSVRVELQGSRYRYDLERTALVDGSGGTTNTGFEHSGAFYDTLATGEETLFGGFANAYAEVGLPVTDRLTPRGYLGAGIGMIRRSVDMTFQDAQAEVAPVAVATDRTLSRTLEGTGIGFQWMVGMGLDIGRHVGVDLGYKMITTPEVDTKTFNDGGAIYTISGPDNGTLNILEAGFKLRF